MRTAAARTSWAAGADGRTAQLCWQDRTPPPTVPTKRHLFRPPPPPTLPSPGACTHPLHQPAYLLVSGRTVWYADALVSRSVVCCYQRFIFCQLYSNATSACCCRAACPAFCYLCSFAFIRTVATDIRALRCPLFTTPRLACPVLCDAAPPHANIFPHTDDDHFCCIDDIFRLPHRGLRTLRSTSTTGMVCPPTPRCAWPTPQTSARTPPP